MDQPDGDDRFYVYFPTWCIVDSDELRERGLPAALTYSNGDPAVHGALKLFALFTDRYSAELWIEENNIANREPFEVSSENELKRIAIDLISSGVTHVFIDPPSLSNPRRERGRVCPFEKLQSVARERPAN